jgi:hypothetical protein
MVCKLYIVYREGRNFSVLVIEREIWAREESGVAPLGKILMSVVYFIDKVVWIVLVEK